MEHVLKNSYSCIIAHDVLNHALGQVRERWMSGRPPKVSLLSEGAHEGPVLGFATCGQILASFSTDQVQSAVQNQEGSML